MNAIGVTLSERASRTDDYLAAMRALWYDTAPIAFSGRHTSFSGLDANPRPAHVVPIVVGGRTPGAYRRAIEQGNGWYGFFLDPQQSAESVSALRDAANRYERPAELGELEISITPSRPVTAESLEAYAAAGVHRLIVYPLPVEDEQSIGAYLEAHAALVG